MTEKQSAPVKYRVDMLGCDITEGNIIAYPAGNSMQMGEIIKIHPKMITVKTLPEKEYRSTTRVYPFNAVLVSQPDALAYLMRGK